MATQTLLKPARSFNAEELARNTLHRRATEAAIWGMPIVSVYAMRQGFFGVDARYGDIAYFSKPADWKLQLTTPNCSSLYVYFNFNLKDGPVVLDFPAVVGAGLFGSIMDAWQAPMADVGPAGDDQGKGGKYLLLPPKFEGMAPTGYLALHFTTHNGYAAFRAIPKTRSDEDTAKALALVKQLRVYPLSQAANPPQQRYIDIAGRHFDGIAKMDDTFFDSLAEMVNEEPVLARDMVALGQLRSLGIEKGKQFKPCAAARAILRQAADEAHAVFMDAATAITPYWAKGKWGLASYAIEGPKTKFTFQSETGLDVDNRGALFFFACAAPQKLGAASLYLCAARDAANAPLDGGKHYRLRVPPKVPAKQFWAVTVYDLETAGLIRESPKTEVNSYQELQKNNDTSVDIFFGPSAPSGKESNWIFTAPDKQWVAFFRFYGPEPAIRDKTWVLNDIEEARQSPDGNDRWRR